MKLRQASLLILIVLIADQAIKYYIKTNYTLNEHHNIFGSWGQLYFIENSGMAWGWQFGGSTGKIVLTLFRLVAACFGVYYIRKLVMQKQHWGFITCVSLIFAGAVGNLIDSLFYGLIFTESSDYTNTLATLVKPGQGYGSFMHGKVVDMFYFPIFHGTWPSWLPFVGGDKFEFFSPVFNLADASISVGVITILFCQGLFFHRPAKRQPTTIETNTTVNDNSQMG